MSEAAAPKRPKLTHFVLGLLRMGWVSSFLSTSVLDGFLLGFRIGLAIDQSHKIFGTPEGKEAICRS